MNFSFQILKNETDILIYTEHIRRIKQNFIFLGQTNYSEMKSIFSIPYGETKFTYANYEFCITYTEFPNIKCTSSNTVKHKELVITITCENDEKAKEIFNNFIVDARTFSAVKSDDKICIDIYKTSWGWTKLSELNKRSIDTVYLDSNLKQELIKDVENFFNSKADYIKFGIPYKRVYLLSGPPGTGKTSTIVSVASYFNKNLGIINFNNSLDDACFMSALSKLEDDYFLLLEDIDGLFTNRERKPEDNKTMVTFSGLLNILDGVGRKEGVIIFMTTNYINKLEEAIKRPGRIDHIIEFDYAKKGQIEEMFLKFFPNQNSKFEEFYKTVQKDKITIALLQKFFFTYRSSDDILAKVGEFKKWIEYYKQPELTNYS